MEIAEFSLSVGDQQITVRVQEGNGHSTYVAIVRGGCTTWLLVDGSGEATVQNVETESDPSSEELEAAFNLR
jgi:hypothetical protein